MVTALFNIGILYYYVLNRQSKEHPVMEVLNVPELQAGQSSLFIKYVVTIIASFQEDERSLSAKTLSKKVVFERRFRRHRRCGSRRSRGSHSRPRRWKAGELLCTLPL